MKDRIQREDALKHVYNCLEEGKAVTLEGIAGAVSISREEATHLMGNLEKQEWLVMGKNGAELTSSGRQYALQIIRAHRVYEAYLAQETGVEEIKWHREAEVAEHRLSKEEVERLAERLGHPKFDPHGDPIPSEHGEIILLDGVCILACPVAWEGRVVHVEDEPESIYASIVAVGIAPDLQIKILESGMHVLKIQAEGRVIEISKQMAANILVTPLLKGQSAHLDVKRLSLLLQGEKGKIAGLATACRGKERQRLLDWGFVPGAKVEAELGGPFGDPMAYRIKGTLVALRKEQSDHVLLESAE
ncbi:MAG: iron dependent repressor, metal binding and dimerization domain protein [Verrucomicrobiota bacterium]